MSPNQTAISFILLLVVSYRVLLTSCQTNGDIDANGRKLDKIIESLESLSSKYDMLLLNRTTCCSCSRLESAEQTKPKSTSEQSSQQGSSQYQDISRALPQLETRENFKRESRDADEPPFSRELTRDLFHFNKLSKDLNSIPSSSSLPESIVSANDNGKRRSGAGQLEDASGSQALDNLNLILREQLASFRLTLNKLMNRLADHNYQHSVLTNQLLVVKEECSLAAGYSNYSNYVAASSTCSPKQRLVDTGEQLGSEQSSLQAPQMMRSSDATMIVRLLSKELNQLLDERQASLYHAKGAMTQQQLEQQQHLEPLLERDLGSIRRRLDEIDSVVKQTALLVNKWSNNFRTHQESPFDRRWTPSSATPTADDSRSSITTITYTNSNGRAANADNSQQSRWFSGSKVPSQQRPQQQQQHPSSQRTEQQNAPKCQAKTSLVRPTSCRQLRLAGANCTGQYYVFVRGSIKHVYCDMNMEAADEGGGWTVILRRIDKSLASPSSLVSTGPSDQVARPMNRILEEFRAAQVNFALDWHNYKSGFGYLDNWSEFFIGLDLLHQITEQQQQQQRSTGEPSNYTVSGASAEEGQQQGGSELQVDLEFAHENASETNGSKRISLKFSDFHVLDEQMNYTLLVSGDCQASDKRLCAPIARLNGTQFVTNDRLDCTSSLVTGGWWRSLGTDQSVSCPPASFSLTDPIGKQANNRHLYWPTVREPLKQVVIKVRQRTNRL